MPEIGEVKRGRDIGYKAVDTKFIWCACERCRKERWVVSLRGLPLSKHCPHCNNVAKRGPANAYWKGGRRKADSGYIHIRLYPGDFFFPMAQKSGYVPEHRLIMAKHLNRCLLSWEVVHHQNGLRDDNRLVNLKLLKAQSEHVSFGLLKVANIKLEKRVSSLEQRIILLEAEIVLLQVTARGKVPNEC